MEYVLNNLDWEIIEEKYLDVFKNIILKWKEDDKIYGNGSAEVRYINDKRKYI